MNADEIPDFGSDFAQGVLIRADRIVARRRRLAAGGLSLALLVTVAWVAMTRSEAPRQQTASNPAAASATPDDRTAALAYLFPDAAPVERFAAEDSDEESDSPSDSDILDSLDDR